MALSLAPPTVGLLFAVLLFGGLVTGLNGFGFAVTGTALLAALLDPGTAVVVMIIPILAANLSLARELDADGLRSCVARFWPFVAAAAVGTVLGMVSLSRVPTDPLSVVLGVLVLGYVAVAQDRVAIPGTASLDGPVRLGAAGKAAFGLVSGVVFGATNIGVQVVAYLESLDLDRSTFVGVVAMVFLGVGAVRVALAGLLGLYGRVDLLAVSLAAAVPGLLGVAVGRRIRSRIPPRAQRTATFVLLVVVGARLTTNGLGLL